VFPLVPAHVPSILTFRVEVAEALDFEVVLVLVVEVEVGFEELENDVPQVPDSGLHPVPQ